MFRRPWECCFGTEIERIASFRSQRAVQVWSGPETNELPLRTMQLLAKLSATTLFLQELVNCPRQVGAILPSSKQLAVAMARWLPPDHHSYALELGPGTGVVTQALLERGLRQDRLIAIEQSPKMADLLRTRFPKAN